MVKGRHEAFYEAAPRSMVAHPKETPKACRNFIALALEGVYSSALHDLLLTSRLLAGYYDGVIFHR